MQGFHAIIAWQTEHPHWLLNDPDAKIYGTALSNALRHFPIAATQKAIDIGSLVIAAFNFDGVRLATELRIRREQRLRQAQQRRGPGPAQVFQFRPTPQDAAQAHSQGQTPPSVNGAERHGGPSPATMSPRPPEFPADMTYEPDLGGVA